MSDQDESADLVEPMIQVRLIKGASFTTPFGAVWRRGQVLSFPKSRLPDYYRTNPRFALNDAPTRSVGKPKSRSRVREQRGTPDREVVDQPAQQAIAPEPPIVQSKIEDRSKLPGFTDEMIELASVPPVESMKKEELTQLALKLGAASPEGASPRKAKNKGELISWIRARQSQIILQARGTVTEPVEEPEPVEDLEDEEDQDLEEEFEE